MQISGKFFRVKVNQVFLERFPARDHLAIRPNYQARSIEQQTVVPANLVHHRHGNPLIFCNRRQHVMSQLPLPKPEWRSRNIEHEIAARSYQFFDRIDAIKPPVPETLVVPGVFANGQSHLLVTQAEQMLARGGSKIAHLIEDVIGWQQHLRLDELDAPIAQQRRRVHNFFAGLRFCGSHSPANHRNTFRLRSNAFHGGAARGHKRRQFDQITRRISRHSEFRKKNQASAGFPRLLRKLNDFGGVASKVPNCGVDLTQGDLHTISVEARGGEGRGRPRRIAANEVTLLMRPFKSSQKICPITLPQFSWELSEARASQAAQSPEH